MEGIFDDEILSETEATIDEDVRAAVLDGLTNRDDQIERIIRYVKGQARLLESIEAELAVMKRRREVVQNRIARAEYIASQIYPPKPKAKIEMGAGTFAWKASKRCEPINYQASVETPEEFTRLIPESRVPDKAAIKEAIESGQDVPGWQVNLYYGMVIK